MFCVRQVTKFDEKNKFILGESSSQRISIIVNDTNNIPISLHTIHHETFGVGVNNSKLEPHLVEFCPHDTLHFFGFRLHVTNCNGVRRTITASNWGWSCDPFTNKFFFGKNYLKQFWVVLPFRRHVIII